MNWLLVTFCFYYFSAFAPSESAAKKYGLTSSNGKGHMENKSRGKDQNLKKLSNKLSKQPERYLGRPTFKENVGLGRMPEKHSQSKVKSTSPRDRGIGKLEDSGKKDGAKRKPKVSKTVWRNRRTESKIKGKSKASKALQRDKRIGSVSGTSKSESVSETSRSESVSETSRSESVSETSKSQSMYGVSKSKSASESSNSELVPGKPKFNLKARGKPKIAKIVQRNNRTKSNSKSVVGDSKSESESESKSKSKSESESESESTTTEESVLGKEGKRERRIQLKTEFFKSVKAVSSHSLYNLAGDLKKFPPKVQIMQIIPTLVSAASIAYAGYFLNSVAAASAFIVGSGIATTVFAVLAFYISMQYQDKYTLLQKVTNFGSGIIGTWRDHKLVGLLRYLQVIVGLGLAISGQFVAILGVIFVGKQFELAKRAIGSLFQGGAKVLPGVISSLHDYTKRRWNGMKARLLHGQSDVVQNLEPEEERGLYNFIAATGDMVNTEEFRLIANKRYDELKENFRASILSWERIVEHLEYNKILHDDISMSIITRSIIHRAPGFFQPNAVQSILDNFMNPLVSSTYIISVLQNPDFRGSFSTVVISSLAHQDDRVFAEYFFGLAKADPQRALEQVHEFTSNETTIPLWKETRAVVACVFFALIMKGDKSVLPMECDLSKIERFSSKFDFGLMLDIAIKKSGILGRIYKFKTRGENNRFTQRRNVQIRALGLILPKLERHYERFIEDNRDSLLSLMFSYRQLRNMSHLKTYGKPLVQLLSACKKPKLYLSYLFYYDPKEDGLSPIRELEPINRVYKAIALGRRKKFKKPNPCDLYNKEDFQAEKWLGYSEESLNWKTITRDTKGSIVDMVFQYKIGISPFDIPEPRPISLLGFPVQMRKRLKAYCEDKEAKGKAKKGATKSKAEVH